MTGVLALSGEEFIRWLRARNMFPVDKLMFPKIFRPISVRPCHNGARMTVDGVLRWGINA